MATAATKTGNGGKIEVDPTTGERYQLATADDVADMMRRFPGGLKRIPRLKGRKEAAVASKNRCASA